MKVLGTKVFDYKSVTHDVYLLCCLYLALADDIPTELHKYFCYKIGNLDYYNSSLYESNR